MLMLPSGTDGSSDWPPPQKAWTAALTPGLRGERTWQARWGWVPVTSTRKSWHKAVGWVNKKRQLAKRLLESLGSG